MSWLAFSTSPIRTLIIQPALRPGQLVAHRSSPVLDHLNFGAVTSFPPWSLASGPQRQRLRVIVEVVSSPWLDVLGCHWDTMPTSPNTDSHLCGANRTKPVKSERGTWCLGESLIRS